MVEPLTGGPAPLPPKPQTQGTAPRPPQTGPTTLQPTTPDQHIVDQHSVSRHAQAALRAGTADAQEIIPEAGTPLKDVFESIKQDPLLGSALAALQGGQNPSFVIRPLHEHLGQQPDDQLKHSYHLASEALTQQMLDPHGDPELRGALNHLVTAATLALRDRGIDPLNLP